MNLTISRSAYESFCETPGVHLPLFYQSWWLDAVCGGADQWAAWTSDNLQNPGIWSVFQKRKGPLQYITMPRFTYELSWRTANSGHSDFDPSFLLQRYPNAVFINQQVPIEQESQFREAGFKVSPAFSYKITEIEDPEKLFSRLSELSRRNIRKAGKQIACEKTCDSSQLYRLCEKSMRRHGIRLNFSENELEKLVKTCCLRSQGSVFEARDSSGAVHAAAWLIWDDHAVYYLLAGMDERIPQIGASRFLMWEGIKMAMLSGRVFDFHGGQVPEIGRVYASMGGKPIPYIRARHYPSRWVKKVVELAKKLYSPGDQSFH